MEQIKLAKNIYYIGNNDRKKFLFENNWPLPYGVSYNSYLIKDNFNALIDTIEFGSDNDFISKINDILSGNELNYLIVNHMEPDHSGSIGIILNRYPNIKVVGNTQTHKILKLYFDIKDENFLCIKDGDILDLGEIKLQFSTVPWVHWPETMVTMDIVNNILFSCDAFGGFGTLDGGIFDDENDFERYYLDEMRRYYSNIVGKYSCMVQKALAKLGGANIKMIAPSHGLIWRKDIQKVVSLYDKWSRYESEEGVVIVYASMYGNTEKMADYIGKTLASKGVKNIKIYDVSRTHVSYLLSEIWRYKGLILGTCAYNTQMHPMMEHLCNEIKLSAPKEKVFGVFGSSTWNGSGVKALKKFAEENQFEIVTPIIELSGAASEDKIENYLNDFSNNFVSKIKE